MKKRWSLQNSGRRAIAAISHSPMIDQSHFYARVHCKKIYYSLIWMISHIFLRGCTVRNYFTFSYIWQISHISMLGYTVSQYFYILLWYIIYISMLGCTARKYLTFSYDRSATFHCHGAHCTVRKYFTYSNDFTL